MPLNKLAREIEKVLSSKQFNQTLGEKAKDIIVKRTRGGRGVTSDKSDAPGLVALDKVGVGYSKWRRRVINRGKPFPGGRKSRLTLTGQMLNAIVLDTLPNGFILSISPTNRQPVQVKRGGGRRSKAYTTKTKLNNRQLAEEVGKLRPFFALADREQRIIFTLAQDLFNAKLRKIKIKV